MVAGNTTDTTYYMGSFEYKNGELNQVFTSEGRVRYDETSGEYHYDYYLKDHLGNTRVLFTDSAGTAQVLQVSNYYPFGMQMAGPSYDSDNLKYLYNGKELHDDQVMGAQLNWYSYGARFYNPQIGRWMNIDPMAEKYDAFSPYNYCVNDPVNRVDPDGMEPVDLKPWYWDEDVNGRWSYMDNYISALSTGYIGGYALDRSLSLY